MTKRYYQRDYEELYYIIDSNVISEKDFDEKVEYDGYTAFEDSLTGEEIVNLLNENEQLKQQISDLKEDVPLLLTFYRWYPFAVEKKEYQAYNRLWDFVND